MASIERSEKLQWENFGSELEELPLDVYYQTITSTQYNSNNVQFKIQAPVPGRSLLDCDVWIKYNLRIYETTDDSICRNLQNRAIQNDANLGNLVSTPVANDRFAFRGGNIMWRAMANFMLTINNQSINIYPHKFIDVYNRLHVSNDQSEHEFSGSGGAFDSGNHGSRTEYVSWANRITPIAGAAPAHYRANNIPLTYGVNVAGAGLATGRAINTHNGLAAALDITDSPNVDIRLYDSYYTAYQPDLVATNKNFICQMLPEYPLKYEFYNPGFSKRMDKMIDKMRSQTNNMNAVFTGAVDNFVQFPGEGVVAGNQKYFLFEIFERLPCSLFKMYKNDGKRGVIPNIRDMQIQINWLATAIQNILKSSNAALGAAIYWAGVSSTDAELYLRWYTPPQSISIPMEISLSYRHIDIQSFSHTAQVPAVAVRYHESTFTQYNISLQAVPDLLLIYCKIQAEAYTLDLPDDFNLEIVSLIIDIDSSSGKLNKIQTIDLYKKWKSHLQHNDSKIIGYDEWRKYCCVAVLKPEDIGLKIGPGMAHLCTLGLTCTFRNWHNNPAIMYAAQELFGGAAGANISSQVQIVAIYDKYKLTLGGNGVGKLELQRLGSEISPPDISMLQERGDLRY